MSSLDDLLEVRERKGLQFVLSFRVFFVTFAFILSFFVSHSRWELLISILFYGVIGTITVSCFFLLKSRRWMPVVGIGGSILDLALIATLPFIWHKSVGGDLISRAYMLKLTNLTAISFLVLIINSVASRPQYPGIITVGVGAYHGFLFWYVSQDSRVVFGQDYVRHMLGPEVRPDLFWSPLLSFLGAGLLLTFFAYMNRRGIRDAVRMEKAGMQVSRYFSPRVYEKIASAEDTFFSQPGRAQEVAILFSDLRGFTPLSESLPPEEVISLLKEYHAVMVEIIFRNGGTLDKFIGDAIMATFGTPETDSEAAAKAVRTALEMSDALVHFNQKRAASGKAVLRQGIGVHTGNAVVGNIGSEERLEYTVIGDAVNIASRVESATKRTESEILITDAVMQKIQGTADAEKFRSVGRFQLKGKAAPLPLYGIKKDM